MFRLLPFLMLPAGAILSLPSLQWQLAAGGWYLGLSALLFFLYRFDKRRAEQRGRRIPERTLHRVAVLGGWPGALLGQTTFQHKTSKQPFRLLTWIWVGLHQLIALAWIAHTTLPGGWSDWLGSR